MCLGFLFLVGCGGGDRPPLGMVEGVVTLDGKPLAGALVTFEPVASGRASTATTGEEGKYALIYIRQDCGAKIGEHVVRVSAYGDDSGKSELLPPRYNVQSTLKKEVKRGENTIDLALTSK